MIHYKQINPTSSDNTSSGYAINDYWVNIITYTKYEQTSNGVWVWREFIGNEFSTSNVYPRLNQQAGSVMVSDDLSGDGTLNNPISFKPKLDFLLVDAWRDDSGEYPQGVMDGETAIYNKSVGVSLGRMSGGDEIYSFGYGSVPFVPISQTTIFVHPTTFQRYMFNGTTMVEYDDVDGIVPKWLKYEALLTQIGTDAPIARVLNADERDYLEGIAWAYYDFGWYQEVNNKIIDGLYECFIGNRTNYFSCRFYDLFINNKFSIMSYSLSLDSYDNDSLINTPISIKQRVRGNPPKIVTAETNVEGTKVILTFDKNFNNDIVTNYGNKLQDMIINVDGQGYVAESDSINRNNILELSYLSGGIINGTIVSVSYIPLSNIESLDFGLLQPFYSIPVTNNVPAPPQILNAYTNEAGTEVILEFDKPMAIPTLESTFDTSSNYLYVCMYRNTANETYIALNQEPTIIGNTLIFPCDAILYGDIPYVILLNAIFYASNGLSLENFTDYSLAVQTPYLSISNIFTDGETITMEFDQILDTTSIGDANVFFMIDCNGYTYNVLIDSYIFDNNKLIFTPVVGSLIVGGIAYALEYSGNWAKGIDGSLLSPISTFGNPNVSNYSTIQI